LRRPSDPRAARSAAVAITLGLALIGCSAVVDTRGYLPDAEALARIKPGEQTRSDVTDILGTPSSVAPFDDSTWFYIERKTRTVAFFEPKVLEQNVVVVDFDEAGMVKELRRYSLADGMVIDPVTRKTPAPGKELTFLEQLIGNVGKFTSKAK
jgi:outer membrane protein assembly factor BamE (lipoprotein component of BamABCDE complex)